MYNSANNCYVKTLPFLALNLQYNVVAMLHSWFGSVLAQKPTWLGFEKIMLWRLLVLQPQLMSLKTSKM